MTKGRRGFPVGTELQSGIENRARILAFMGRYEAQHGFAPHENTIAAALNMAKMTVYYHLKRMEALGVVKKRNPLAGDWEIVR